MTLSSRSGSRTPALSSETPAPRAPASRPSADNILARILGIMVFLGGIGLLWYVFQTANGLFNQPAPHVSTVAPAQAAAGNAAAAPSAALEIGRDLTEYLKKLLTLLLMCVAGSLISSAGIRLYFSAGRAHAASQSTDPAA